MILWYQWFSEPTPKWIHCCKRPNYDFCISQDSAGTVLRWGGQNYSHLRQVKFFCVAQQQKIIKIGQYFTVIQKNNSGTDALRQKRKIQIPRGKKALALFLSFSLLKILFRNTNFRTGNPLCCFF